MLHKPSGRSIGNIARICASAEKQKNARMLAARYAREREREGDGDRPRTEVAINLPHKRRIGVINARALARTRRNRQRRGAARANVWGNFSHRASAAPPPRPNSTSCFAKRPGVTLLSINSYRHGDTARATIFADNDLPTSYRECFATVSENDANNKR